MVAVTEFAAASINEDQVRLLVTPYQHCLAFQMEHRSPDGAVVHTMKLELARDTVEDLAHFIERWSQAISARDMLAKEGLFGTFGDPAEPLNTGTEVAEGTR